MVQQVGQCCYRRFATGRNSFYFYVSISPLATLASGRAEGTCPRHAETACLFKA